MENNSDINYKKFCETYDKGIIRESTKDHKSSILESFIASPPVIPFLYPLILFLKSQTSKVFIGIPCIFSGEL